MTTTLAGTLGQERCIVFEMVEDPNTTPRYVVGGSAASVISGTAMMGKPDTMSVEGQFRSYGNGNVRLVLGSSTARVQTFALRALNATQIATMQALLGHTVVYCDTYGRRVIGAFLSATAITIPNSGNLTDFNVSIQTLSYNEAV